MNNIHIVLKKKLPWQIPNFELIIDQKVLPLPLALIVISLLIPLLYLWKESLPPALSIRR